MNGFKLFNGNEFSFKKLKLVFTDPLFSVLLFIKYAKNIEYEFHIKLLNFRKKFIHVTLNKSF